MIIASQNRELFDDKFNRKMLTCRDFFSIFGRITMDLSRRIFAVNF